MRVATSSVSGENVLFGVATFAYFVLTLLYFQRAADMPDVTPAYALGHGAAPALLALATRGIYVVLRRHRARAQYFSGWLLVLAAAFALMGNVSALSEQAPHTAPDEFTAALVVDALVADGTVDLQPWCMGVAGRHDVARASFKRGYGTRVPPAEAVFDELVSRCNARLAA